MIRSVPSNYLHDPHSDDGNKSDAVAAIRLGTYWEHWGRHLSQVEISSHSKLGCLSGLDVTETGNPLKA